MKFHILIFGCQMNYADSARIKEVLLNCGFSYTENIQEADIVIFDTCSVRQKAEDKITGKLKELKKTQKIWITGCMIQHNLRSFKLQAASPKLKIGNFLGSIKGKKPEIMGLATDEMNKHATGSTCLPVGKVQHAAYIGINNSFNPMFHNLAKKRKNLELMRRIDDTGFLPLILQRLGYKITYDGDLINEYEKILPTANTSMNLSHQKTAYIPISTGCNQFCSYCIVPYARGLEKNFPVEQIIQEAKKHLERGVEEIVLIGQIVNKHPDFVLILEKILKLKGLRRLRYTSPYPTFYSKELLHLHETEEKLCPHIHIPFQSGSDKILKSMHRGYTLKQAKKFIDDIRSLQREISITTDIIVGFPGETEKDFSETLKLARRGGFDMIYIGIYSPRPGTYADKNLPDTIPYKVKHARRDKLNELLKKTSLQNNKKEVGKIRTVLINDIINPTSGACLPSTAGKPVGKVMHPASILGYTDNMKQIILNLGAGSLPVQQAGLKHKAPVAKPGSFVQAKVSRGVPFKLYGEII